MLLFSKGILTFPIYMKQVASEMRSNSIVFIDVYVQMTSSLTNPQSING
jgi:hypothetical protein